MALHMCGVNTSPYRLLWCDLSSAASQLGGLTFRNLTLLIYKMGIILYYEGTMPCCVPHAPHYIILLPFNLYYKYSHQPCWKSIQKVPPRPPLARCTPQGSGLVTRQWFGIDFPLWPRAPPWPLGARLTLVVLPLAVNFFSASLWKVLYEHLLLHKLANLNHVLSIFRIVDTVLKGHEDFSESKYLKFCNQRFWTSLEENVQSMTRPEYTEKIIYSIGNQEFYFICLKYWTINEILTLSTWNLNLNEFV